MLRIVFDPAEAVDETVKIGIHGFAFLANCLGIFTAVFCGVWLLALEATVRHAAGWLWWALVAGAVGLFGSELVMALYHGMATIFHATVWRKGITQGALRSAFFIGGM